MRTLVLLPLFAAVALAGHIRQQVLTLNPSLYQYTYITDPEEGLRPAKYACIVPDATPLIQLGMPLHAGPAVLLSPSVHALSLLGLPLSFDRTSILTLREPLAPLTNLQVVPQSHLQVLSLAPQPAYLHVPASVTHFTSSAHPVVATVGQEVILDSRDPTAAADDTEGPVEVEVADFPTSIATPDIVVAPDDLDLREPPTFAVNPSGIVQSAAPQFFLTPFVNAKESLVLQVLREEALSRL